MAVFSSLFILNDPLEKPTPAGPYMKSTFACLFQLKGFTLKFFVFLTNIKGPLE